MAKVTYDDLMELAKEIERGSKDKSRTIESVNNPTVRNLIQDETEMAMKAGVTTTIFASSVPVTGTLVGAVGGAGAGAVYTGLAALGIPVLSATGGAVTGAAVGSVVPIVGTILGTVIGVGIGAFVGSRISKRNAEKKQLLLLETIKKQNACIRDLERELQILKEKYQKNLSQNARYKYIIGLIMAYEEFKKFE